MLPNDHSSSHGQTLWRTETGHCIQQVKGDLPELLRVTTDPLQTMHAVSMDQMPRKITIETKSPSNPDQTTNVTLTISPTPIASTIQVTAQFSEPPLVPAAASSLASTARPSRDSVLGSTDEKTSESSLADDVQESCEDIRYHAGKRLAVPTPIPESPSVAPSTGGGAADTIGRHSNAESHSSKKSHTFFYRFFHASHDVISRPPSVASSRESMNEEPSSSRQPTNESNTRGGGNGKNAFLYRLLHHHQHHQHHADDSADHHDHGADDHENCIAKPPQDPTVAHRRRQMFHRIFHHFDHHHDSSPGTEHFMVSGRHSKRQSNGNSSTEHSDADHEGGLSSRTSMASFDMHEETPSPPPGGSDTPATPSKSHDDLQRLSRAGSPIQMKSETHESSGSRRAIQMFKQLLLPPKARRASSGNLDPASAQSSSASSQTASPSSEHSLFEKYGFAEKVLGKGAGGVVRLFHKIGEEGPSDRMYAVKEFRKRRKNESEKDYLKKLTSEFCISSNLHHINVVETLDLVQDEKHRWCEIMEYCPGGDLYEVIRNGKMTLLGMLIDNFGYFAKTFIIEINCCFKQLIHGIHYLHSMGVAHR